MLLRLALILAALVANIAGYALKTKFSEYYSIAAAVESGVSGYIGLRGTLDEFSITERDGQLVRRFRELISSDAKTSIVFLQLAVVSQSIASLHPFHSVGA